jgi:hypothetical protein
MPQKIELILQMKLSQNLLFMLVFISVSVLFCFVFIHSQSLIKHKYDLHKSYSSLKKQMHIKLKKKKQINIKCTKKNAH